MFDDALDRCRKAPGGLAGLLLLPLLLAAAGASAAPPPAPAATPGTPRGAVLAFLDAARSGDFAAAARALDLSRLPQRERAERGPRLARELSIVLDRKLWVDPDSLSDDPAGSSGDGLPPDRDRVGVIQTASGPVAIDVERRQAADGSQVWQFAASTLARVPALYEEFGYGALGEWLPASFFERQLLDIRLWQWLGLLLLATGAYALSFALARALLGALRPLVARTRTSVDDRVLAVVGGPLRLGLALALFAAGAASLGLAVPAQHFFERVEAALAVVVVTWLLLRVVDVLGEVVEARLLDGGRAHATSLVPLGRKTLKVATVALASLAALDTFGFDVTALIAGLGVGGLAVALAAQKTIENLFGGATLLADRPVSVGDFCRFGDQVGVVEEIGLRSTRVRTLGRTIVTVPNAEFSALQLENFAVRDRFWFNPKLGVRYETTPDQLRWLLVELRRMLYSHAAVDPDPARVRFLGFGACSLDLEIFAYVRVSSWDRYLEVAEDLNLRIMEIVERAGTGFAFPSSTTYLARDSGLDAERSRSAVQEVQRWRAERELYLPGFPPEVVAQLRGTLRWPPEAAKAPGA